MPIEKRSDTFVLHDFRHCTVFKYMRENKEEETKSDQPGEKPATSKDPFEKD